MYEFIYNNQRAFDFILNSKLGVFWEREQRKTLFPKKETRIQFQFQAPETRSFKMQFKNPS